MNRTILIAGALALMPGLIAAAPLRAEDIQLGKREFESHCVNCHGAKGKGDGPLSKFTLAPVADLTAIQKNNKGLFPADEIHKIMDGSKRTAGHGVGDMPFWGQVFRDEAPAWLGGSASKEAYSAFVRAKIEAVIAYIKTLQVP